MPLQHKTLKVVSTKGTKKVRQVSSGTKTQITVLGCASATGQVIPPMVVFTGKHFNHMLSRGEVPGTLYSTLLFLQQIFCAVDDAPSRKALEPLSLLKMSGSAAHTMDLP